MLEIKICDAFQCTRRMVIFKNFFIETVIARTGLSNSTTHTQNTLIANRHYLIMSPLRDKLLALEFTL